MFSYGRWPSSSRNRVSVRATQCRPILAGVGCSSWPFFPRPCRVALDSDTGGVLLWQSGFQWGQPSRHSKCSADQQPGRGCRSSFWSATGQYGHLEIPAATKRSGAMFLAQLRLSPLSSAQRGWQCTAARGQVFTQQAASWWLRLARRIKPLRSRCSLMGTRRWPAALTTSWLARCGSTRKMCGSAAGDRAFLSPSNGSSKGESQ